MTLLEFFNVIIALIFAVFIVALLLTPLETLNWWTRRLSKKKLTPVRVEVPTVKASYYLVFLDGIAKASRDNYEDVQALLDKLAASLTNAVVIGSIIPYSVVNQPLTRSRPLAAFWRWAKERKLRNYRDPLGFSINIHNLFQAMVSADSRYGPVYNFGQASSIIEALIGQGYRIGCGVPITLIGYSGGAQIAAGVAPYLKELLRAPIDLISLGGVISADQGLLDVRYLYHLAGEKDSVEKLGTLFFPGRWPFWRNSSWNRAKRHGKFTFIPMGPMNHNRDKSYLDKNSFLETGISFLDFTASLIAQLIMHPEEVQAYRRKKGDWYYLMQPEKMIGMDQKG